MNVTGFTAAIEQFERSLPTLDQKRTAVQARFEQLVAEAVHRGVEIEEEFPDSVTSQQSLLDFFRRHRGAPLGRD
jgi:vacuolar-type H+-ATPase subunit D/Vma8